MLPNPSGLNAHYLPKELAEVFGEAPQKRWITMDGLLTRRRASSCGCRTFQARPTTASARMTR